ncbi:MAG: HAMP domain-containing histidine kinase [Acidimicrobiales bacterium]|nr:HAMP domain-containing histidine kinase [Acidimicrobiales bacterium]
MSLRARLTLALTLLSALGLAVFGVATYSLYARSRYEQVDDQLRSSVTPVTITLFEQLGGEAAGFDVDGDGRTGGQPPSDLPGQDPGDPSRPDPQVVAPTGTYGELRDPDGAVLARVQLSEDFAQPDLDDDLELVAGETRIFETGSEDGGTRWRVFAGPVDGGSGRVTLVAVPLSDVEQSLHQLILIELAAGATLLALLAGGSWLVLRRGLHPLERMATTARTIRAGDLHQRVEPADGRSEVGELGLAINTMLGELEEAFAERDATERKLRQFLADASHELRTPLTSIQGFAELFRLGQERPAGADGEPAVDLPVILRRIEQESARMKTLVEDLLMLARLDETREIESAPVDLSVLAADACTDAVAAAPDRTVTLDAPDPVVVSGDRDQLRQAIANLVTNAVKHTPEGTALEVATRVEDGHGVVSVRDHGPGIAGEDQQRVFDRFWRADESRTGSGAGLGLSIVAAITGAHGGEASVENLPADEGGGARFTLRLPL